MELKYTYLKGETPEERLRNKLQPLFSLVSIVELNYEKCPQSEELKRLLAICKVSKEDVLKLLSDITPFYAINKVTYTETNTLNFRE